MKSEIENLLKYCDGVELKDWENKSSDEIKNYISEFNRLSKEIKDEDLTWDLVSRTNVFAFKLRSIRKILTHDNKELKSEIPEPDNLLKRWNREIIKNRM